MNVCVSISSTLRTALQHCRMVGENPRTIIYRISTRTLCRISSSVPLRYTTCNFPYVSLIRPLTFNALSKLCWFPTPIEGPVKSSVRWFPIGCTTSLMRVLPSSLINLTMSCLVLKGLDPGQVCPTPVLCRITLRACS